MPKILGLLIVVSILTAGCASDPPTAPESLTFETLAKESTSGFGTSQRRGIANGAEWLEAWQTLYAGRSPVPALPAVDFGRETVVLAATGDRSNSCHSIAVTGAALTAGGTIEIEVTETLPGTGCVCLAILTRAAHAVRVPRAAASLRFVERAAQGAC